MKTVGVGGNNAPFVVALLLFLQIVALKSVGGTFSLLLDKQFQSLTFLYFVGPTVLSPWTVGESFSLLLDLQFLALKTMGAQNCRNNKIQEGSSNSRESQKL